MFDEFDTSYHNLEKSFLNSSIFECEEEQEHSLFGEPVKFVSETNSNSHKDKSVGSQLPQPQIQSQPASFGFFNPKFKPITDNGKTYNYEDNPTLYRKIRKRIQNRKSSQKKRTTNKSQLVALNDRIKVLEEENQGLKTKNLDLVEQNNYLSSRCAFFERTLKYSLQQHEGEEDEQDIDIVTNREADIYHRVEKPDKQKQSMKNFVYLTVFTVLLQIIDLDFDSSSSSSSNRNGIKLKSLDIDATSTTLLSSIAQNLPSILYFSKQAFIVLWVFVLLMNYKRITK